MSELFMAMLALAAGFIIGAQADNANWEQKSRTDLKSIETMLSACEKSMTREESCVLVAIPEIKQ